MATFGNENRKNGISTAEKKYFLVATFGNENSEKGISTGEKKGISNVKIRTNKKQ